MACSGVKDKVAKPAPKTAGQTQGTNPARSPVTEEELKLLMNSGYETVPDKPGFCRRSGGDAIIYKDVGVITRHHIGLPLFFDFFKFK